MTYEVYRSDNTRYTTDMYEYALWLAAKDRDVTHVVEWTFADEYGEPMADMAVFVPYVHPDGEFTLIYSH